MNKDWIDFTRSSIELLAGHVEKYLGPLPEYEIELKKKLEGDPDVPFSVGLGGKFVFYREGLKQRLSRPLQEPQTRIHAVGDWIHSIIHDLIHLYQGIAIQKKFNAQGLADIHWSNDSYWCEGLAEYISWKICLDLYREAKDEGDYWKQRKNIEDILEAIKLGYYRLAIERRIIHMAVLDYFILANKGAEKEFVLPKFLPKEIMNKISLSIKERKLSFGISPYARDYFLKAIDGDKKATSRYLDYSVGFACITRLINNGEDFLELLSDPRTNQQLLELAAFPGDL